MSSRTYWKNREEEQRKKNIRDEAEYAKEIEKIYANMMDEIQKEMDSIQNMQKQRESQLQKRRSGYPKWTLMRTAGRQSSM